MKIWVLGAGGLLGSAFTKIAKVLGIDCLTPSRSEVDVGDFVSLETFIEAHPKVTHIVNCSAFSLVDLAETKRQEAWLANALGPENLGKIANQVQAKIIHISTDYVFAGDLQRPVCEDDPILPLNYYGKTKREGEIRLLDMKSDACIIRTSSIFGFGGKNFASKLLNLFKTEKEILLSNDQWVRPTYAKDLSLAILKICHSFQGGIYHFANAGVATKFEFGCKMREILEQMQIPLTVQSLKEVPSSTFASPCKRPVFSVFDTAKIEKTFQIGIRSWEEALQEFLVQRGLL